MCFQTCVYGRLHHQSQVLKVIQFTFSFQCYIFEKYFYTCLIFTLFISLGAFFFNCDWSFLVWRITLKGSTYGRGVNVMFTSHFLEVTIFLIFFVSSLFIFTFVCQKRDLPKTRWVDIHQGVTVISMISLKGIKLIRFCCYHYENYYCYVILILLLV